MRDEERRRELKVLIEKAKNKQITYEEAQRLRKLLEEEERRRIDIGDIVGAIAAFLLIWLTVELIKELFEKRK